MNFVINSIKENKTVCIILIILFIFIFFKNNYENINRYKEGYKYPNTNTEVNLMFNILPNEKIITSRSTQILEKIVDERLMSFEYVKAPHFYGTNNKIYFNIGIHYIINTDKKDFFKSKNNEIKKLFYEEFKKEMVKLFKFNNNVIFIDDEFYLKIKNNNLNYKDFVSISLNSISYNEILKLGQKNKVLLSKTLVFNFLFNILAAILICVIYSIIKMDISKNSDLIKK